MGGLARVQRGAADAAAGDDAAPAAQSLGGRHRNAAPSRRCHTASAGGDAYVRPDDTGANLLFVVGCPRSGTTWVQRLLATHPCIRTGQESDLFDLYVGPQLRTWQQELTADSSGRGAVGLGCYFTDDEFRRTLKSYL